MFYRIFKKKNKKGSEEPLPPQNNFHPQQAQQQQSYAKPQVQQPPPGRAQVQQPTPPSALRPSTIGVAGSHGYPTAPGQPQYGFPPGGTMRMPETQPMRQMPQQHIPPPSMTAVPDDAYWKSSMNASVELAPQGLPPSSTQSTGNSTQSTGNNTDVTRDLVKKFIADIWNRGELDLIPDVVSPSLRFNGNQGYDRVGHEGLARMVGTIRDALDDYHCEIHSMVVEGNKAFCRLRFTGKHTGPLLGFGPTNKVVAWMGATEFTVQNGKILKVWELGDVKSLEEQLGALPPEEQEV